MKRICNPTARAKKVFRKKWFDYYGFHCAYCTKDCSDNPTIDHLVPLSKGGGNRIDNMVIACFTCNKEKADKRVEEFKPLILSPLKYGENYGIVS